MITDPLKIFNPHSAMEAERWEALVNQAPIPDVYYRPGYVRAHALPGQGDAVCLYVNSDNLQALVPLLVRNFSELSFAGGPGYDAATAYGYGGILPLKDSSNLDASHWKTLLEEIRAWCQRNQVVSVLLRLHPLLKQYEWAQLATRNSQLLFPNSQLRFHGPTTGIDLANWDDKANRLPGLNKGRRSDLGLGRRELTVTWATPQSHAAEIDRHLAIFRELYNDTMRRIGASAFYFFPQEYYGNLFSSLGNRPAVAVAWRGDEPAGAVFFFFDFPFAHYHLSATNALGQKFRSTTLLICEGARRARQQDCKFLHLGGGAGGEDSLFQFKQSFGGPRFQYGFATLVADPDRYRELLEQRHAVPDLPPLRPYFFPEYRA